jgi:hypothetical protein
MTARSVADILKDAGKQLPDPSAFGANDMILAAAIIAQAIDKQTEAITAVTAAIKAMAEKPK